MHICACASRILNSRDKLSKYSSLFRYGGTLKTFEIPTVWTKTCVRMGWAIKAIRLWVQAMCLRLVNALPLASFKLSLSPQNCDWFCLIQSCWNTKLVALWIKKWKQLLSFWFFYFSFLSFWHAIVLKISYKSYTNCFMTSFSFVDGLYWNRQHTYQHVIISILFCYGYS